MLRQPLPAIRNSSFDIDLGEKKGIKGGMLPFESLIKIFVLRIFSVSHLPLSTLHRKSTQDEKFGETAE